MNTEKESTPTPSDDAIADVSPNAARISREGTVLTVFGAEVRVWEPPTSGAPVAEISIVVEGTGATLTFQLNRAMMRALGAAIAGACKAGDLAHESW